MKSFLSLVGVAVVFGSIGCGTTINVQGDDGDGSGGSGEGGASTSVGPVGPSTSTGVNPPPNPPECPGYAPYSYDECYDANVECAYLEERGCTVSYTCVTTQDCPDGETTSVGSGYGGYGGCYDSAYWQPTFASCQPAAVDCYEAAAGDVCAFPGDSCYGGYDECGGEQKWCGDDHTWQVEWYEDECCYDDCCYDDCYCEPYYCPEYLPQQGEYCDPCYDSSSCGYDVPDEYCGYVYGNAYCNPDTYSWDVYVEGCVGTGGSGQGGGWEGTGGGWEGTGGGWESGTGGGWIE